MADKTAITRPAVQFYEAMPEDAIVHLDSGHQPDATATSQVRTPETGSTELPTVDTVYRTARHDQADRRREPAVEPTQGTRERKVLQYGSEESDDDDAPEQRHPKRRTETDAKAGATRHSSRHSNGTSKRVADPADAKVSSTQHSPPKSCLLYTSPSPRD